MTWWWRVIWCSLYRFCRVPSSAPHQLRPLLQLWLSSIQQGIDSRTGTISSLFVRYCWGLDGFPFDLVVVGFERFWCNRQFARLHQVWSCTSLPGFCFHKIFKLRFKHVNCTRRFYTVSMFIHFGLQKNHLFASGLAGVDPSTIDDLRFVRQQDTTGESRKWHLILWIHQGDPSAWSWDAMHPTNTLIQCQATLACLRLIMPSQSILWQCAESYNPISHRHSTKWLVVDPRSPALT